MGSWLVLPPLPATFPSVTHLPLLFAPQTRKRGGPVAAGRWLQEDEPSWQPGSLGLPVPGSNALRHPCFREVPAWGLVSGGEELGHSGLCGRVTPPSGFRAAMLPWKQSSIQCGGVLAKGHPLPRSSGSITLLTPGEASTQITLVLSPPLDPARVSWLIKFKLRKVKLCARGI